MQHMLFCYLWIKSRHQWSITLCWTLLFWPLLGLVLLNYALVLGHWPTSKDFIWNSYVKCIIIGSVREPKKHWALYHPELSLLENKEDISLRFTNREQLCFYWKTDLISYYGPCEPSNGSCFGHKKLYLWILMSHTSVIQYGMLP